MDIYDAISSFRGMFELITVKGEKLVVYFIDETFNMSKPIRNIENFSFEIIEIIDKNLFEESEYKDGFRYKKIQLKDIDTIKNVKL